MPSPVATSRSAVWLVLLAAFCLLGGAAQAQIVKEKPAKVKAANRRALREARRTDSPYKDSHLDVTAEQLKRGKSTQSQADISRDVNYSKGTAPNVKPAGLLGLRRDKTTTLVRKEQRQRRKLAARNDNKK